MASDIFANITPPSPGAVWECADLLGEARSFYTTPGTVADLEDLRRAVGTSQWTIDGISYGSYVAQHYA